VCRRIEAAFPGRGGRAVPWEAAAEHGSRAGVVVNATSVGLPGGGEGLPPLRFSPGQLAVDFVYGDTAFSRDARRAGARLVTGEEVLVRQGALAFALWIRRPAPLAAMAEALGAASGARSP